MLRNSSRLKVRAQPGDERWAVARLARTGLVRRKRKPRHDVEGHACVRWSRKSRNVAWIWSRLFCSNNPWFSSVLCSHRSHWLLDDMPEEQSDLSCPWTAWCCVIYSGGDLFPQPMNFNIFFPPFQQSQRALRLCLCSAGFDPSHYLTEHPITTCPAEGRNSETLSKTETADRMLVSSEKIRSMHDVQEANASCWQPVMSDIGSHTSEHQNAALKLMSTYFHLPSTIPRQACICQPQLLLTYLIFLSWANCKWGDARSVHQKPLVVCH